jgi:hypothetical protein
MVICSKFELFRIQNCRGSLFFNPPVLIFVHISIEKMGMWLAYSSLSVDVCTNATSVCFVEGCGLLHYVLRNGNSTITRQPWRAQRNEREIVQS